MGYDGKMLSRGIVNAVMVVSFATASLVGCMWIGSYWHRYQIQPDTPWDWTFDLAAVNGVMVLAGGEQPTPPAGASGCSLYFFGSSTASSERNLLEQFSIVIADDMPATYLTGDESLPVLASSEAVANRFDGEDWHRPYGSASVKLQLPMVAWLLLISMPGAFICCYRWGFVSVGSDQKNRAQSALS